MRYSILYITHTKYHEVFNTVLLCITHTTKRVSNIFLPANEWYTTYFYLCLFLYSGVKHISTTSVTRMEPNKRQNILTLRKHMVLPLGFCWDPFCSSFYFSVLCFVCLRPVSCVPNFASISGLSIRDCTFDFL